MDENKLTEELIQRYLDGKATPEEQAIVESWYLQQARDDQQRPSMAEIDTTHRNMRDVIIAHAGTAAAKRRPLWPRIAAAASILVALGIGGYFVTRPKPMEQVAVLKPGTFKNDAMPGNKAILTLANGQQLAITSLPTGHIQNTSVQKTSNGALVYSQSDATPDVYNTLTVPRGGGKHQLKLADGTLVVLDAGSSIRFPVAFNGRERKVSITGQAYFEVVHKADQPFSVTVGNQIIRDIGTHFNVNGFDHQITLIEGSISVNDQLLKPGQQMDGQTIKDHINESVVLAWKNDLFSFEKNTSIEAVMSQLSRWYDMDVVYQGKAGTKTYHFGGDMPRYEKLSDVLTILSSNGAQFSVDGKKIIVYQ